MGSWVVELGRDVRAKTPEGHPVTFKTQHEALLLGALALSHPLELDRAALARGLWPEASPDRARMNLRQRVAHLRAQLGPSLDAERETVRLDAPGLHLILEAGDEVMALERCRLLLLQARREGLRPQEPSDIRAWARHCVQEGKTSSAALEGTWDALFRQWESRTELDDEQALDLAIVLSSHPTLPSKVMEVLALPHRFGVRPSNDPERRARIAYLFQQTARWAHGTGNWARSVMDEQAALQWSRDSAFPEREVWSQFRLLRKAIDLRLTASGVRDLCRFGDEEQLGQELAGFVEMNVVHAASAQRQFLLAQAAAERCRRRAMVREYPDFRTWLDLNLALCFAWSNEPRRALGHLRAAFDALQESGTRGGACWHWVSATPALQRLGRHDHVLFWATLADRARRHEQGVLTPTNERMLRETVLQSWHELSPERGHAKVAEAEAFPLVDAVQAYGDCLARLDREIA